jgi:hypothetical protein
VAFPRIHSVEDGPPDSITDGVVLIRSQRTAAMAGPEIGRRKPSSHIVGKALSSPRPKKT